MFIPYKIGQRLEVFKKFILKKFNCSLDILLNIETGMTNANKYKSLLGYYAFMIPSMFLVFDVNLQEKIWRFWQKFSKVKKLRFEHRFRVEFG